MAKTKSKQSFSAVADLPKKAASPLARARDDAPTEPNGASKLGPSSSASAAGIMIRATGQNVAAAVRGGDSINKEMAMEKKDKAKPALYESEMKMG